MFTLPPEGTFALDRRLFLHLGAAGVSSVAMGPAFAWAKRSTKKPAATRGEPTKFQIACMTLPYAAFPLRRALAGIKSAGYRYVTWGTTHLEDGGKPMHVMPADAPVAKAKELGRTCRDMGLEPLMMFSEIYPEHKDALRVLRHRVLQAEAAGIPQVLTFGHTRGGNDKVWIKRFKELGPVARKHGVLIVVKQHGGNTGTGAACAAITREVADEGIKVNYDAGNVMDYLNLDPLPDIKKCASEVRSFCIKDHRRFPRKGDCGPGLGEIDHYRLLAPVAFTGLTMPLCCENIFAPVIARPKKPEGVDALARRAREFLQIVIQGLQT
jgi:sugar phosphate isomerase/epimerase